MKAITRAELLRLGRRPRIRAAPRGLAGGKSPQIGGKSRHADPTMAPTRGLTPAIVSPGIKRYLTQDTSGEYAVAVWSDDRARVPVRRVADRTEALTLFAGGDTCPPPSSST
jgi:hypothetical protein